MDIGGHVDTAARVRGASTQPVEQRGGGAGRRLPRRRRRAARLHRGRRARAARRRGAAHCTRPRRPQCSAAGATTENA